MSDNGACIVMSSHDLLQAVSFSDNICVMDKGKVIISGPSSKVTAERKLLYDLFGAYVEEVKGDNLFYDYCLKSL